MGNLALIQRRQGYESTVGDLSKPPNVAESYEHAPQRRKTERFTNSRLYCLAKYKSRDVFRNFYSF